VILQLKNVKKNFEQGAQTIEVLKDVNLNLENGEVLALVGPSGSGKSTLLALMAGLDQPSSGSVHLNNETLSLMNENELTRYRSKNIGIIFQQFHLLSHLTALENVALPLEILGEKNAEEQAREALAQVGLSHRLNHFPFQMSGGEGQRVAIARALVTKPALLLADEPSGNLDVKTGDKVMDLLFKLVAKYKITTVLITHSPDLTARCSRKFAIENGSLKEI
jgi:putative ABC transport system ATP-binding protein